ncbi:hypothetical protein T459_15775 [Capsicum annuum]|uniref:Uncharacterized protein n=1 Tax=Capsicum annuum TaxID=4072 RepID=A0A2G2Z6V2_CAPAN|nr:hypothetical protein T459_15775 [Capsicum annuum]
MGEGDTFENLKYLGLNEVTLAKWEFGEESFPVLEKLALWRCRKLTEIPPNFGDIGSLKIIQLDESPQLEDSALEIKQYVEDITGEDKLQILSPNNIPLSKTGPEIMKGREGEVTLVSPLSSLTLVDKHILHGVTFQQVYRLQNPDAYGYVPRNAI